MHMIHPCIYLSILRRLGVSNQLTLDRTGRPRAAHRPARDGGAKSEAQRGGLPAQVLGSREALVEHPRQKLTVEVLPDEDHLGLACLVLGPVSKRASAVGQYVTYLHDTRLARYTIFAMLGVSVRSNTCLLTSAHASSKPPLNVMCTAW